MDSATASCRNSDCGGAADVVSESSRQGKFDSDTPAVTGGVGRGSSADDNADVERKVAARKEFSR